jgi:TRAP-type C4-dicarboxylate transport system substrate-binding protein
MFCQQAFTGLGDLAGRRVRVSSVGQSELIEALGATPVVTPFAEIVPAIRGGVVQCAITGTLSGNAIGVHEVTTHVSRVAISWGVSIFGANERAWAALPEDVQGALRDGLATLQEDIWRGAEQETEDGLRCNAGRPDCGAGARGRMTIVEDRPQDRARRQQLLTDAVLPAWVQRCGSECAETWNRIMGQARGIPAKAD